MLSTAAVFAELGSGVVEGDQETLGSKRMTQMKSGTFSDACRVEE